METKEIEKLRSYINSLIKIRESKSLKCSRYATRLQTRKEYIFYPAFILKRKNPEWWILPAMQKIGYLLLFYHPEEEDTIIQCYIVCGICIYSTALIESELDANIKAIKKTYTQVLNSIHLSLLSDPRVSKKDIIKIYDLYNKYGIKENQHDPIITIDEILNR